MSPLKAHHEQTLKHAQLILAILVGVVTLVVGGYNLHTIFFAKKGPGALSLVVRAGPQPVPQAVVELYALGGALAATGETGPQGTYEKRGLEPGNYTLKVRKPRYQPEMMTFAVTPATTAELTVPLTPETSSVRSSVEDVGAAWIRKLGAPKSKTDDASTPSP